MLLRKEICWLKYFNKHFKTLLSWKYLKKPTLIQKSEPYEHKCKEDRYFPKILLSLWNSGDIKLLFWELNGEQDTKVKFRSHSRTGIKNPHITELQEGDTNKPAIQKLAKKWPFAYSAKEKEKTYSEGL